MNSEHPFASFIRILGKGPHLSRALSEQECYQAVDMIMKGQALREQVTAFLCLLRIKTETVEEMTGFIRAVKDNLKLPSKDGVAVDLDWPSYAGKARRLPWFLLSALLLSRNDVRILMHGAEGHTAGRLYSRECLELLGIPASPSLSDAATRIKDHGITWIDIGAMSPVLAELMELKSILGLRNPVHSVGRALNPLEAPAQIMSVAHSHYLELHRDSALRLGQQQLAVFKGEGGEAERRPDKTCHVHGLENGALLEESWPALPDLIPEPKDEDMDPARLVALWSDQETNPFAEAVVISTAAIALKLTGKASSGEKALALAGSLWANRDRTL